MRSSRPPFPIRLQPRDIELLRGLFECRVMTADHVSQLYFCSHREMAKKRLQKLKAAGFAAERPRKTFEPSVLSITERGIVTLREQGVLDLYPPISQSGLTRRASVSEATLRHELSVMDVKVAFHRAAAKRADLSMAQFTTWPLLNQFMVTDKLIKPDAFIRIQQRYADGTTRDHALYLELDRSTEGLAVLAERARAYLEYHKSRRVPPFRVLYVLKSQERRDNIAARLCSVAPAIHSLVWLATTAEVTREPFAPIWLRTVDYRDAERTRQNGRPPTHRFRAKPHLPCLPLVDSDEIYHESPSERLERPTT